MKNRIIFLVISLLIVECIYSQKGFRNNGAKIIVGLGTKVLITGGNDGNYTSNTSGANHGRMDLDGTLQLEGSFNNNATGSTGFINMNSTGTVVFSGTSQQSIGGASPIVFENITLNNNSGLSFSNAVQINNVLNLTNGVVYLGNNNLTIAGNGTISGGTFNNSRMIILNGTGELRKVITGNGSFTFPIGENTGTMEYSPVMCVLNSNNGLNSAYIAAKVVDNKHPNNTSLNDYLTRYWTLTSSGITNPNYNATFVYVDADIVGTEANIYGIKYEGLNRTVFSPVIPANNQFNMSNQTLFGDFTGEDGTPPALAITSPAVGAQVVGSEAISFTNSEPTNPQVSVDNANWTTAISGTTVLSDIPQFAGLANGEFILYLRDIDAAGNLGSATASLDKQTTTPPAPLVSLLSAVSSPTNQSSFGLTITFTMAVTGFDLSDINVVNGNASNLQTSNNTVFTATIAPQLEGNVVIIIPANAAISGQGIGNVASSPLTIVYDITAPVVTINSPAANAYVSGSETIVFTNSESTNPQMSVDNSNWTNATSGVTILNNIPQFVSLPEASFTLYLRDIDLAGNLGVTTRVLNKNTTAPLVNVVAPQSTNQSPFNINIVFTTAMTGFDNPATDITVTNGSASNIQTSDNITFTVDITPVSEGNVNISIPAGVAVSVSGGVANLQSSVSMVVYDVTAPTVTVTSLEPSPTNNASFNVTLQFSERVSGLNNLTSDFAVTNCYLSSLVTSDSTTFTVTVNATDTGALSIQVNNGAATDAAGNNNSASNVYSNNYQVGIKHMSQIADNIKIYSSNGLIFVNFKGNIPDGNIIVTNLNGQRILNQPINQKSSHILFVGAKISTFVVGIESTQKIIFIQKVISQ